MSTPRNVLSSDVEIIGELKFGQDLIIDGKIDGEVSSDGTLTIGENAKVKGKVEAGTVTVFGAVEGDLTTAERCVLKANSEVIGDIRAGSLTMEEGASFAGQSAVGARAAAAKSS